MSARVLVTGASGFVGRAVAEHLAQTGYSVRLATRRPMRDTPAGAEVVLVPSMDASTDWRSALTGIDTVIHCAAHQASASGGSPSEASVFHAVNRDGTLALAHQASQVGVRRLVFLSSVKVNGETSQPQYPFRETDRPAPCDPYGESKLAAEAGLMDLAAGSHFECVVLRLPLVYGPGAKGNFATMLRWVRGGIPLPLGAVTENRRSILALGNLVDLNARCVEHRAAANQVFLATDTEDLSTAELLRRVGMAVNQPARLLPVPVALLRTAAVLVGRRAVAQRLLDTLQVDASKVRSMLGWVPPQSVDVSLRLAAAGHAS